MIKVAMVSLGCPKNQVDAEKMLALLKKGGLEITPNEVEADAIIINTCGFIESAKAEAIENILEASRYKEDGSCKALIVTGCLAERYRDDITEEIPEVDVCVGLGSNSKIAEIVKRAVDGDKQNYYGEKTALDLNGERILGGMPYTAYLKIGDGCDNCCSYCAIPKIRGRMRSRTMEECISETKTLAEGGVTELIVVAQDTTAYGTDLYGEPRLWELLERLCKIEGLHWIRTLYTYPERIDGKLLDVIKREEKLVKYLDIPIQHINDDILKKMNRKGSREDINSVIDRIREKIPEITLRTTLITGFPTETEEQFEELAEFVKEKRFDKLGCFTYSPEEGTIAARMEGQLDEQTKQDRCDNIMEMQTLISASKNEEKIGRTCEVLVEGWDDYIKCYFGRASWDAPEIDGKVFFMANRPLKIGQYVKVKINDCLDYDLLGELL